MKIQYYKFFLLFILVIFFACTKNQNSKYVPPEGMVFIPEGNFIMGSNKRHNINNSSKNDPETIKPLYIDEYPERTIFLKAYFMDKFEVTAGQYNSFNPSHKIIKDRSNYPVVNVDWYEANRYCRSLKKRLPTEEEWEKAARGTKAREFPWGNKFDASFANTGIKSLDTTPVGNYEKGKSPYGIYDMAGNVWEWTFTWYNAYPGNKYKSKDFGKKFKVIRGGARGRTGHYNLNVFFRSAHRFAVPPENKAADTGFRCVGEIIL